MAVKDPFWNQVILCSHFDALNGTAPASSVGAYLMSVNGNVFISTDKSKFGSSSLYCDGGGWINVDSFEALADFTIDFWMYPLAHGGMLFRANSGNDYLSSGYSDATTISWMRGLFTTPASHITLNAWNHISLGRAGSLVNLFINGVRRGWGNFTESYGCQLQLFGAHDQPRFHGYIDDLRITKADRYGVTNFTVPAESFGEGGYLVEGAVRDTQGNGAPREIRVYRRDTGALVGGGMSSGSTGQFSIAVNHSGECQVVLLDNEYGTVENDQIIRAFPI